MKTLMLSAEDIKKFGKYLPNTTTTTIVNNNDNNNNIMSNIRNLPEGNLVALQYYLKHSNNYAVSQQQQQHQQQQQQQQKQIQQLKQPNINHPQQQQTQHINNYHHTHNHHNHHQHHHHPYYQQINSNNNTTNPATTTIITTANPNNNNNYIIQQQHTKINNHQQQQTQNVVPVHALNQNSNFSAASSSTGGGTTTASSSHAPTQQSNTTGSSFSPPGATANKRTTPANNNNNNNNNHNHNNNHNNNNNCIITSTSSSSTTTTTLNNNNNNNTGTTSTTITQTTTPLIQNTNTNNVVTQQIRLGVASNGAKKLKTEPVLSHFHQTERLTFANTHIVWNEEHWKRVVFQDERKFNLDGPDGFSYYFHDLRNYERSLSQRPRGNSVFVYLVITAGGPIHLDVSTTKQKPETCIESILRERTNICNKLGHSDFMLQDHNWLATTLPTAQEWLSAEGIKLQKWPTIAHDLNIMENIWGWLIREVYDGGRKFSRKDDLIFRIKEAWTRLPLDLLTNLYSTLPERITELYYTRGVYTNC